VYIVGLASELTVGKPSSDDINLLDYYTRKQQQQPAICAIATMRRPWLTPKLAFLLVSFSLGELGDGLNIFQGIYLVGVGWNEGRVGLALSLMGLTALVVQPWAGDWVDKTTVDRRLFLAAASIVTAISASTILLVRPGNVDHMLIFISKVVEGVAASFIGPCVAALTLATFGPRHFDAIMASNILYGHLGSVVAAILAGLVAYGLYPNTKYCFLVIGSAALFALAFIPHLPQGDPLMGRGFQGKVAMDEEGHLERLESDETTVAVNNSGKMEPPQAANYFEIFLNKRTSLLCLTGFFFHFANANVLLVLGELMGQSDEEDGGPSRSAIPLIAGAIVTAQMMMAVATAIGNRLTIRGVGRKPLFMAGLLSLPIRCALIIWLENAGDSWLLSTQLLDGIGGGLLGLIHPVSLLGCFVLGRHIFCVFCFRFTQPRFASFLRSILSLTLLLEQDAST